MSTLRTYRLPVLVLGMAFLVVVWALSLLLSPALSSSASTTVDPPILSAWIVNTTGEVNPHWSSSPVNVQSVTQIAMGGVPYVRVQTHSIANYHTTMTDLMIQELNSRPRAATDFRNGQTTATVGQDLLFGDDIGYRYQPCALGHWPPGPSCPSSQNRTANFPMQPLLTSTPTTTGLGAIGLWVNGVAIYNWSDGQSYQNGHVWYNTALSFEKYDMDICPGHAAMGDYHHHSDPECLGRMLGDTGAGHSPVYGFAADGFPVYGPYESAGVVAESGWKTRDYDDPNSPTGCGTAHVRNCLLRDPLDPSQGTIPSSQTGPRTDVNVTTMSGNVISATSGIFFQDYYYDSSCTTCLDAHNGIDDGDGLGYHYHVTVQQPVAGARLVPVFPYVIGPTYAGQLSPAATYTPTPSQPNPTNTATPTATGVPATAISTRTATGTATRQGVPTSTSTAMPSNTPTSVAASPTRTSTQPVVATATPTRTFTPTGTATPGASATQVQASATSVLPTATGTPFISPTSTLLPTATACVVSFLDVSVDDYFYEGVRYLFCAGVISGYGDGTFRPYNNASRGQITKIVVLAFGYELHVPQQASFSDVPPGSTFFDYVETAVFDGLVSGYGDGTFRPGSNVTRGQLSKIVALAAGWTLVDPPTPHFSDVLPGDTFYEYVETAFANGVINGYGDGTFRPGNNATRGQISKIVFGALR